MPDVERLTAAEVDYARRLVEDRHAYLCNGIRDIGRRLNAFNVLNMQADRAVAQYTRQRERLVSERDLAAAALAALTSQAATVRALEAEVGRWQQMARDVIEAYDASLTPRPGLFLQLEHYTPGDFDNEPVAKMRKALTAGEGDQIAEPTT